MVKIRTVLIIILITLLAGCIDEAQTTNPSISTQTASSPLITKSPSEMGLKIGDLPTGWLRYNEEGNETYYSSAFSKESYGNEHTIIVKVSKFSVIDGAKQAFNELKNENSDYKLVSAGLGDDSFALEYSKESLIVFRKANIIIESLYGKQFGSSRISDAKDYAEIIEKKIRTE